MPKLERLDWLAPISEGHGVTLSNNPEADLLLAENPTALLLGVLYDSQYRTRLAFAIPYRLKERLGYLDMLGIASSDPDQFKETFLQPSALHRFPNKFAQLTLDLAAFVVDQYNGDPARIWREADNVEELGRRLLELPSFGVEKTNWTVGMLGRLDMLTYDGWQEYRVKSEKTKKAKAPATSSDGV